MTLSVLRVSSETPCSESQISGSTVKHPPWKQKKKPIEEDINKLFHAIDGGSFRGRRFANRTAMKRPVRSLSPQVLTIGISDSMSLKRALRGLCISQASEMAAAKKRSCSTTTSEAGAIMKLHKAVGPKRISSKVSTEALEYEHLAEVFVKKEELFVFPKDISLQSAKTESGTVATFETRDGPESEETLELPNSSIGGMIPDKQVSKSCKILPIPGKSSVQDKSRFTSLSWNHNVSVEIVKGSKLGPAKLDLLVKKFVRKKMATKDISEDERSRSVEKGSSSQSSKNSTIGECSSTTSYSGESYPCTSTPNAYNRHYMSGDLRWKSISLSEKQHGKLSLKHFNLLRMVGSGHNGTVYVARLIETSCLFAIKVVDKERLISRKMLQRAQTEREILEIVEHPFLPTLYANLTTNKYSCLIMEYCPGGNLHMLRQKQLTKCFSEKASRFYVAEVVLALEYLHMLGVIYRDLKPENILVGEDGHIMLSDFNSSVRCTVNPVLLNQSSTDCEQPEISNRIHPFCLQPSWQLSCFTSCERKSERSRRTIPLPQLVIEPMSVPTDSFVGKPEYLAPEIIKGECYGSAVDWWAVGILLYELLYGRVPFTGKSNKDTMNIVISHVLKFPVSPVVSSRARDLIRRLLKKEPDSRLGSAMGAGEIKLHPFFDGLNWALIRCETPPELPKSSNANDEGKKYHE